jgi:hypothetical protein
VRTPDEVSEQHAARVETAIPTPRPVTNPWADQVNAAEVASEVMPVDDHVKPLYSPTVGQVDAKVGAGKVVVHELVLEPNVPLLLALMLVLDDGEGDEEVAFYSGDGGDGVDVLPDSISSTSLRPFA